MWYRFNRFDRILIISSAIGLLLSTVFIFEDRWIYKLLANNAQQLEKIGVVKTAVNDVRQRHADAFAWLPLEIATDVYQGDSIFTGEKSEAVVLTDRGEKISISPNSLVVINALTDAIRLDIDYGSVLGEVGKDKKLLIASGGDVTEFKGDDAVVKVDVSKDQNLVVNVLEGQVEVNSDGGGRTLGPKEKAEISDAGTIIDPSDVSIELLTPVPERVLKPDESRDLVLTWRSNYPFSEYTVEIARDAEFKKPIVKEKANRLIYRPTGLPTNERVFWRVSAMLNPNQAPAKSAVAGFTIIEDKPPTLSFPRDNMRLAFEEQPMDGGRSINVVVRWVPRSASSKWELQLSNSPDFARNLKTIESQQQFADVGALTEDSYYARIRSKDWADAIWSETIHFTVAQKSPATLRAPQVLTAEEDFMLVTKYAGMTAAELSAVPADQISYYVEAIPQLAWNTIVGASSYEIEIASDKEFTKIWQRAESPTTRYRWSGVRLGDYFWRIRSLSAGNRRGPFTEPQPLRVRLATPQNLTNEKTVEEVTALTQMDSAPAPFLLRWTPTLLTSRYEVEFDKDPKLKKPLKVITANPFKKVQAPSAGTYFWRVRALDSNGNAVTDWTETFRYDFSRVYLSPETTKELKALYPNNETIMLIGKGEIKINFRWVTPIKTGKLRFQLSDSPEFTNTRLDFLTDKDFFLFREEIPDGNWYWRLRVENPQFTSPWTAAYPFQVQHEFSPFNFERSEKNKEQEIKTFEVKRGQEMIQEAKENLVKKAELARLEFEAMPQLEAPTDLATPEFFALEARPLNSTVRELEQIPDHQQYTLLKDLPVFDWAPITGATEYRIEIAADPGFKSTVENLKVSRPSHRWLNARPGVFYWRVKAIARGFRDSGYSEVAQAEIGVAMPYPVTPHAMSLPESANKIALLKWNSVPFAHSYEVEWSPDPDFARKVASKVSTARLNQTLSAPGVYFWRVRAFDANKSPLTEFTPARIVNIAFNPIGLPTAVKTPMLLYPADKQSIAIPNGTETPRVNFAWHAAPIDGQFVLEIARDKEFSDVLQRINTKGNSVIADAPPTNKNELYWRLEISNRGKVLWRSAGRQIKFSVLPLRQPAGQQKIPTKTMPSRAK